jgi:hypothetical protein
VIILAALIWLSPPATCPPTPMRQCPADMVCPQHWVHGIDGDCINWYHDPERP